MMEEIYSQKMLDSKILSYFRNGWSQDDTYHILRDYYYVYDFVKLTRQYVRDAFKSLRNDPIENQIRKANIDYIKKRKISKRSRIIGLEVRLGLRETTDPEFKEVQENSP